MNICRCARIIIPIVVGLLGGPALVTEQVGTVYSAEPLVHSGNVAYLSFVQ